MRVLVTGSRGWVEDWKVEEALHAVEVGRNQPGAPFVVVHGGCPTGADAHAKRWVEGWRGYPVPGGEYVTEESHPADWSRGRGAGPARNAHMVNLGADLCLAFISECTSPHCHRTEPHDSHGASMTVAMARTAGIPVQIYRQEVDR